jgi:iron(III) transport system ATP-binding protein
MYLQLEELTKRFPAAATPALDGVSLTLAAGETLCLAGASGSGKTTLLRLLAGLDTPTAGRLVLDGQVLADATRCVPPEERGIGLVPQDYALFPHLTVARNIAFGLHRWPRRQRTDRVAELVTLLRLDELTGRYPHELSGGQCQRAALARALAPEPRLLLLDEAFSSLDPRLRRELVAELAALLRVAGTTTVCITHDAADALALGTRLAVLDGGRLAQLGAPAALRERPATPAVADFFGVAAASRRHASGVGHSPSITTSSSLPMR